jgi:23S rRNA pseudouridine1911/1915/1917 synthase
MEEEIDRIWIQEEEAGERLDKVLASRFKEIHSRTYFQMLIDEQLVLVNGAPVKKRSKLQAGDEVEIQFALTPEIALTPENIPLDILYEDEYLLVINKPVGMVVHPAPGNWSGTFVNALLHHCRHVSCIQEGAGDLRPGIVHRLDKNTSGALIAAKTITAQQRLTEMFAGREIYKEYQAICVGNPGNVEIAVPIQRHPIHRQQMAVAEPGKGKSALTKCETLVSDGKISIVKVIIATGRTHQIRVHLKHVGTPVLGDPVYGLTQINKKYHLSHQMLHAHVLRFKHPISGKEMEFTAPIPQEMQRIIGGAFT